MTSNRWWEFYFIRYFIGSMLGAVIIIALAFHPDSSLADVISKTLHIESPKLLTLKVEYLWVMLFMGISFCYIASAPVLVLHTCRAHLNFCLNWKSSGGAVALGLFILAIIVLATIFCFSSVEKLMSLLLFTVFFILQFSLVILTSISINKDSGIFSFYKELTTARNFKETNKKEYIESYKHLREHGNAFFILICEFALGMALFKSSSINEVLLILLIWISPAMTVWLFATYLESKLKDY